MHHYPLFRPLHLSAFLLFSFGIWPNNCPPTCAQDSFVERIRKRQDSNSDGKIAKSESTGLLKQNFGQVDTNGDGFADREELQALARRFQANRNRRKPNPNQPTVPENVEFQKDIPYRKGNESWKLDLAMPRETGESPRPALVFVHGGGWRGGDKSGGVWSGYPIHFAQKGYVCVSINYRLSQESPFPACLEDCKCAVRWLRAHAKKYNVDVKKIGAYGNSAGAHLVSMLGLVEKNRNLEGDGPYQEQSSLVQAVVPSATPADFSVWAKASLGVQGRLLAGDQSTLDDRAKKASPVSYARPNAPPFLIFHGTADRTVPLDQGKRLEKALKAAGAKDVVLKIYDGAGHGVFRQHEKETLPLMEQFFDRHLRSPAANPSR